MSTLANPVFTFTLDGFPADTFDVLRFRGTEGLSELYEFEVLLVSDDADIDLHKALQGEAHLRLLPPFAPESGLDYTGVLASFSLVQRMNRRFVYRACLRHKFWWLTLLRHNRVFLDKTPVEACTQVLQEAGLSSADFRFSLSRNPERREFFCQYDETDFQFVTRWLEYLGICFWFEHKSAGPCCVFTDNRMAHQPLPGNATCEFHEPSGLNPENPGQVITHFSAHATPLPKEVEFRTWNPQKPSLDLTCKVPVSPTGHGTFYRYGVQYETRQQGEDLARIEAEALICHSQDYTGLSHNPALRPGALFTLRHHYRSSFNQSYLTTRVEHEGSQSRLIARSMRSGAALQGLDDEDRLFYRNSFVCIPASTQYRPLRTTPWPRVAGNLPARIDGQGTGAFAELDAEGRYKVVLPFDLAQRGGGKASCWVRMMQPYAGEGMGFFAPLHKGTEVMLSFVGGNPDEPVITAAVFNPQTPSQVTDANATQIQLHSAAGQKFLMEDAPGREHILLSSPDGQNYIKIGMQSDD
ncbi:MAG TPA: type VI secretion system tip protein VgrG [Candidatus Desulfovibrio intestinipullorum]|uniref:Type VI secretion system tip protein VgrG n=1 Tax=Candidatus Desulfovibrio intestinipullorum TaxID=2838536 RepID=A0A9D1TNZ2_9BACT|nr:type VI secretion system tip protein VgrG [Candidatus Desulfovibrio intestinipullorum]